VLSALAFVLGFGWDLNRLRYPLGLSDALYAYATVDTWGHGDLFGNTTYGFPFGWEQRYFPTTDVIQNAIGGLVVLLTDNPFLGLNTVFVLSFPATALAALWVLRIVGLRGPTAVLGSLVITTLPFHWLRVEHPYLASMYSAVLAVGLALLTGTGRLEVSSGAPWWRSARTGALLVAAVVALSGVYFALFAVLLCSVAFAYRLSQSAIRRRLVGSALPAATVSLVTGIALIPATIYVQAHPALAPVAGRRPIESVSYSGDLLLALLPAPVTRVPGLHQLTAPLTAAMETAGTTGVGVHLLSNFGTMFTSLAVVLLLGGGFVRARRRALGRHSEISDDAARPSLALVLLLLGTAVLFFVPFGLNLAFAGAVSPQIRGWDRLVVVVLTLVVAGAAVVWRDLAWPTAGRAAWAWTGVAFVLLAMDSVVPHRAFFDSATTAGRMEYDQAVVYASQVDTAVPGHCGVLQLPYQDFPESAATYRLPTYQSWLPRLTDSTKSWSYGTMRDTLASAWAQALGDDITPTAVNHLRAGGFCVVHVDRRGYPEQEWAPLVDRLTRVLGQPVASGHYGDWFAFRLPDLGPVDRIDPRNRGELAPATARFYYPVVMVPTGATQASEERDSTHRWWWLTAQSAEFDLRALDGVAPVSGLKGTLLAAGCGEREVELRLTSDGGSDSTELHLAADGRATFDLTLPRPTQLATLTLRSNEAACPAVEGRTLTMALIDPVIE
jgi:phosphoglycerol transferase